MPLYPGKAVLTLIRISSSDKKEDMEDLLIDDYGIDLDFEDPEALLEWRNHTKEANGRYGPLLSR